MSQPARLRTTIDGPEKFCTGCEEWWPADNEFFFSDPRGAAGLYNRCKACYRKWELTNPKRVALRGLVVLGIESHVNVPLDALMAGIGGRAP